MERLSPLTDIIYVHVEMDVLDPERLSRQGAYRLMLGAVEGVRARAGSGGRF